MRVEPRELASEDVTRSDGHSMKKEAAGHRRVSARTSSCCRGGAGRFSPSPSPSTVTTARGSPVGPGAGRSLDRWL